MPTMYYRVPTGNEKIPQEPWVEKLDNPFRYEFIDQMADIRER